MQTVKTTTSQRFLMALPWAAIPLLGLHLRSIWDLLPLQIATHFNAAGHPNGWDSKSRFAVVALASLAVQLGIFTAVSIWAFRVHSAWRMLTLLTYIACGGMFTLHWQLADHAAFGTTMSAVWPMPVIIPLAGFAIAASMLLRMQPEPAIIPHPEASVIAEEQHRSLAQLLFVVPGMGIGAWLATNPIDFLRVIGIALIAMMAWVSIGVIEGFRYLVRTDGVQIKGFLMPLRFIPRSIIRSYRADRWTGLGYGVRTGPRGTAYIWGGREVVNIVTDSGDVMLGHQHPERLIQELDRMMQTPQPV